MKVGVLTENFIDLIGAKDFISHIIYGLLNIADEKSIEIFVLVKEEKEYRKLSGLKRLYKKILYDKNAYNISKRNNQFEQFDSEKLFFVGYTSDVISISQTLGLDFLMPHMNSSYLYTTIPNVGYLYDCQHKYLPNFFAPEVIKARDEFFSEMAKQPLVVNSRDTRNDYIKFYNANPDTIYALPFTPKLNEMYLSDYSEDILKYNLPKKYFLSSNQFWVHKDHATLFRAFAKFIETSKCSDFQLVCTGTMEDFRKPNYIKSLEALIKELNISDKVRLLGLIPKNEQIEIMKGCVAVIQTTLFEGGPGGGSVWDALSIGAPAIVSDIPVNLEIESELVTFFKTSDVDDLTTKMHELNSKDRKVYSSEELSVASNRNARKLGLALYEIMLELIDRKRK